MDIDLLSKMVKELILDEDRVVLPGLGCFVAEIVPASFSDKGYTINPPYRKLYFRSRPDEGDTLIDFYAKSNKLDYEIAEKIIKDFVSELKSVLHHKKIVVFPGLGRLRATKENNVFFVADEDLDIYPEGFGLEPISLKTHQETREEVAAAVVTLKDVLTKSLSDSMANPEPEPEPVLLASAEKEAEKAVEDATEKETETEKEPEKDTEEKYPKVKKTLRWGRILAMVLILLAVLVVIYMIIGRLCPEWIDQFLYTPEELEILNR